MQANGTQQVIYLAPASVAAIEIDAAGFTITENGQTVTGSASVQLDAGPSIASQALPAVEEGETTVIGTITPGLPGDTLTLTQSEGAGTVSLGPVQANGTQQVIYSAPASVPASTIEVVSYSVSDQHNDVIVTDNEDVLVDPGSPPGATAFPSGAVAWWTFNNINGALALDEAGDNNGIIVGATPTPGEVGGGLAFDGVDDFVSVPNSSAWDFGSGDFSITFWANFASAPGGSIGHPGDVIISQDEGAGSQNKWFISAYAGFLDFHVNSPTLGPQFFAITPFNPTPGQWYNIALTKSGSQYTFYINGQPAGSATE